MILNGVMINVLLIFGYSFEMRRQIELNAGEINTSNTN